MATPPQGPTQSEQTLFEEPPGSPAAEIREPAIREVFRTKEVVEILGISRRQLQYWAQTDLVVPSAKTPGGHHRYRFEDLVALKAAKRLIDAGVSVQRIRASIQALRRVLPSVEHPLSELVLVATGDVVLVFRGDSAFEAVSGQEWVFEVARFQRELTAWQRAEATGRTTASETERESQEQDREEPAAEAPTRKARSVRRTQKWSRTA